ncbi:S-layer domain protein [Paenibacillus curdlanolyticus YK9]|uniref:S-layer domain protein n=1 Tax=Paenibacillus curdlanolyticus YK9 TaxID=717606 RepID=E0I6N7_9BACL|nr:S-layer homology domain-containing protein [Paenibacillus curdlanolyticus]EFM11703.1 S-layer domain protein [Paenibacillus curdlanolyticus YK9]
MKRWTVILTIGALLMTGVLNTPLPAAHAAQTISFTDISKHWSKTTIEDMVARGILDGYPDGSFRPNEPVKVDQFIKMLILSYTDLHPNGERSWRQSFLDSLSEENRTILSQDYRYYDFKPGTTDYWAKPYIDVASDLHFLNKSRYSDFQGNMTRENVAEVLYYALQETEYLEDEQFSRSVAQSYGDLTSASDRMQKFIAESLVKGIMQGYPNGRFGVGEYVTRAESLVILNRLTDKSKRIPVAPSADKLQRLVPTSGGGQKVIVFPDKRMWDAYDALVKAGELRGANHDLLNTTLRLFKDQNERNAVVSGGAPGAEKPTEEVAMWLDPAYNTYGITVRLREGTLARNAESIELFGNQLFGYDAFAFHKWFAAVCTEVAAGRPLASKQITIGSDTVNVLVDNAAKTVIFSVAAKKA